MAEDLEGPNPRIHRNPRKHKIKSHAAATVLLFLERLEPRVGTWLETGYFQTQPLEGKVASQLG